MDGVTGFDIAILIVLLLSALLAVVRGFVKEFLSVAAFVAAALGALWILPVLGETARSAIQPGWAADAAVLVGAFLLIFLAVTLVTSSLSKHLGGNKEPGMLDRTAGLIFGVARGLVLLGLFVLAFVWMSPPDRPSAWMTNARLYPLVNSTALMLQDLAPETSHIAEADRPPAPAETRTAPRPAPAAETRPAESPSSQPAATPAPATVEPEEDTPAYNDNARRSLDQLISAASNDDEANGDEE